MGIEWVVSYFLICIIFSDLLIFSAGSYRIGWILLLDRIVLAGLDRLDCNG